MSRIKPILEQSGRTLESISTKTGIVITRLQEALKDDSWSILEVSLIAKTLNVSIEDLLIENEAPNYFSFNFRTPVDKRENKLPMFELSKLNHYVKSALQILGKEYGVSWAVGDEADYNSPELLASRFRGLYYQDNPIGPIMDLPERCAEKLGCLIYTINSNHLDGASAFIENKPFVFVARRFSGRMLFTLAHELGHLFRNRNHDENSFYVDEDIFRLTGDEEKFANTFASCLLMPAQGVLVTLQTYRKKTGITGPLGDIEISVLSHMFGVSFEAAGWRCESLNILEKGATVALSQVIKKEHKSAEKRLSEEGLPERPDVFFPLVSQRLLNSAAKLVREGRLSIGEATGFLGIGARDLFSTVS